MIKTASLFQSKAKKWVAGRKNFFEKLPDLPQNSNVTWFHCASLGEYDQGKPIIEEWKKKFPNDYILVTFFSPSGYEHLKDKSIGDFTCYLPLDTPRNAQRFVQHFRPKNVFFVKYEFWYNFLHEARKKNAKLYLVSAVFRKNQVFFKRYGKIFRRSLLLFHHIFVQQKESHDLLNKIDIHNVTVSGDTRYDRVLQRASLKNENPILENWKNGAIVFIIGSSWQPDEEMILPFINENKIRNKIIIAPHEINEKRIKSLTEKLTVSHQLYTKIQQGEELKCSTQILILNCIGVLATAYQYGNVAYVGGGFGTGLHNILEPAAYHLPVIFGPQYQKFPEAQEFIHEGIGKSCGNSHVFLKTYNHFLKDISIQDKVKKFMNAKRGATEKVMDFILQETSIIENGL